MRRTILGCLFSLMFAGHAIAQTTLTVRGEDFGGSPIGGAEVCLYDQDAGFKAQKRANDNGRAQFSMPSGLDYTVVVSEPGYQGRHRVVISGPGSMTTIPLPSGNAQLGPICTKLLEIRQFAINNKAPFTYSSDVLLEWSTTPTVGIPMDYCASEHPDGCATGDARWVRLDLTDNGVLPIYHEIYSLPFYREGTVFLNVRYRPRPSVISEPASATIFNIGPPEPSILFFTVDGGAPTTTEPELSLAWTTTPTGEAPMEYCAKEGPVLCHTSLFQPIQPEVTVEGIPTYLVESFPLSESLGIKSVYLWLRYAEYPDVVSTVRTDYIYLVAEESPPVLLVEHVVDAGNAMDVAQENGWDFTKESTSVDWACVLENIEESSNVLFPAGIQMKAHTGLFTFLLHTDCDFSLFLGRELAADWSFLEYGISAATICSAGFEITTEPEPGDTNIRLDVTAKTDWPLDRCDVVVENIRLRGPVGADPLDAFR